MARALHFVPLAAGLYLIGVVAACGGSPDTARRGSATHPGAPTLATLGDAVVVWESNWAGAAGGPFRIYREGSTTDGGAGGTRLQLSPDEAGREHCCAAISPSGQWVVYLSLPAGRDRYSRDVGVLHLVGIDGAGDRVIAERARHYGEHRAATFWDEDRLVFIDGENRTQLLTLSTGISTPLAQAPGDAEGWLIAPGGRVATGNTPTFSDLLADGSVAARPSLGGCQPFFSADGRFAVWSAGAGGPIDAIDLATRRSWTILDKNDARLPADRGYSYFPALAPDNSLLVVAASDGEHDHFRANYDLFALELDPATLLPRSRAVPLAASPGVDRFPAIWRRPSAVPIPAEPAPAPAPAVSTDDRALVAGDRLAFLWRRSDDLNRIDEQATSEILRPAGDAWYDRERAMALAGGSFAATEDSARRVSERLAGTHQFTLSLLVRPVSLLQRGPLIALSDGPRDRSFVLRQEADRLALVLRTSDTPREGRALPLGTMPEGPSFWTLVFSPGRLTVYREGVASGPPLALPGDFFHWRPRPLTFGAETGSAERWRGALAEVAIWYRPLAEPEIAADAARAARRRATTRPVDRLQIEARRLASSELPPLERISPYREALAVDSWQVVRTLQGAVPAGARLRVARWAILDGRAVASRPAGETVRMTLEPFAAQPQLEPYYLADTLAEGDDGPLWFDLGGAAEP